MWAGSCWIPRYPGIFSKSRSRDSKKSNHGIFGISKSPSTKRLYSKAFNPFHWPYQLVLRPLIAARGSKITFQTFDFSATNIQHGLLVTGLVMQERTYQFTKHLLTHLFQKPMSLNRPRLDLTITQSFSGERQALILGHHVASKTEHPLALAACYRMGWMRPLYVLCIIQTNESSKMYEIDQIYELRRKSREIPYFFGKIP